MKYPRDQYLRCASCGSLTQRKIQPRISKVIQNILKRCDADHTTIPSSEGSQADLDDHSYSTQYDDGPYDPPEEI